MHLFLPKPALAATFIPSLYPYECVFIVWIFKLFFVFGLYSHFSHINQLFSRIISSRLMFSFWLWTTTLSLKASSKGLWPGFFFFFPSSTIYSAPSSLSSSVMTSTIVFSEALIFLNSDAILVTFSFSVSTSAYD